MFRNLFKKPEQKKYPPELYKKFYQSQEGFFDGGNAISNKIYELSRLLEAEQDEIGFPKDTRKPTPYWQYYYWLGDCFTALNSYGGHPLQPKDESYSSDIDKAAVKLMRSNITLGEIKRHVSRRMASNSKVIIFELERLESMIEEKIRFLSD